MGAKYYFLIIFISLLLAYLAQSVKKRSDNKRIWKYYSDKKYEVQEIKKNNLIFGMFSRDSNNYYHVVLKTKSGKYTLRTCRTDVFSGVMEFTCTDKIICKHCHSIIDSFYIECPNCMKAM